MLLLFRATSQDDSNCALQKNIQNTKQEILSDGFQLRFTVENVTAPRGQVSYLGHNCLCLKTQNDDICHLPPDNCEQLVNFLNLLQEPVKKRKFDFIKIARSTWMPKARNLGLLRKRIRSTALKIECCLKPKHREKMRFCSPQF